MRNSIPPDATANPVNRPVMPLLWRLMQPYRGRLALGIGALLLTTAAMLALPQFLRRMFDAALISEDKTLLAWLALGMMLVVVVLALGVLARARLLQVTATRVMNDLRARITRHLLTLDVAFYDRNLSGELMSRVVNDSAALREFIQFALPMLVRGALLGVGALIGLLLTNASLAMLLLLTALPLTVLGRIKGRVIRRLATAQTDAMAGWKGHLGEIIGNIRTVYAFDQQARMQARSEASLNVVMDNAARQIVVGSHLLALNTLLGFAVAIGVVWLGGVQVMEGTFTVGGMMAFLLYLGFMADAVGNLSAFWPVWQSTSGSLVRLMDFLDEQPTLKTAATATSLAATTRGRAIGLHGVVYAYPTRPEAPVLQGIDLQIPAGAKVALVGPSGAGKSSLFRLMQRLDDPQAGVVKLDGLDIRDMAPGELRRNFALVAQDSPMFSGSVRENVGFGRPEATDADIWQALRTAQAADVVTALPQGLDTLVGERGVQLSGGQRQRLALARALLLAAPVLLLDEATSHLDTESEALVQQALAAAGDGRTVVSIAHRMSTVMAADVIYVIETGRVAAQGTHAELMASSPLYRALAKQLDAGQG